MVEEVLAPTLKRDPDQLRDGLCIGPPEHCAKVISAYAEAGCDLVMLWPLGEEAAQIERIAADVRPLVG